MYVFMSKGENKLIIALFKKNKRKLGKKSSHAFINWSYVHTVLTQANKGKNKDHAHWHKNLHLAGCSLLKERGCFTMTQTPFAEPPTDIYNFTAYISAEQFIFYKSLHHQI